MAKGKDVVCVFVNDEVNGVELVDLPTIYQQSDIISLHLPLAMETKHMIDKDAIEMMKPGVMIINTGRGKLIRTEDLVAGLRSGKVGSAGLDVYEEAKYFYDDRSDSIINDEDLSLLLMMPNVIVPSHQAFFTREALCNIANTTLQNITDFLNGKPLVNEVKGK